MKKILAISILLTISTNSFLSKAISAPIRTQDYYKGTTLNRWEITTESVESLIQKGYQIVNVSGYAIPADRETPITTKVSEYLLKKDEKYVSCFIYNNRVTEQIQKGKLPVWCYRIN
jgi:hypothetical protein